MRIVRRSELYASDWFVPWWCAPESVMIGCTGERVGVVGDALIVAVDSGEGRGV